MIPNTSDDIRDLHLVDTTFGDFFKSYRPGITLLAKQLAKDKEVAVKGNDV
jgi:hypothetical protein